MADELNTESTFAKEQPEPSESDLIRKRIKDYNIGLSPEAASANTAILENSLRKGVFGLSDLTAVTALNTQLTEGLAKYQNDVTMAQRRLQELATDEAVTKQEEITRREEQWKTKIADERLLRKSLQDRIVTLEAQLATIHQAPLQTIHAVDEEGVVKVSETNIASAPLQEPEATTPIIKPEIPKTPSKAWDVVRAINPDTRSTSETLMDELEPIPEGHEIPEVDEIILDNEFGAAEVEERKLESTLEESLAAATADDFASVRPASINDQHWDANGSPVPEEEMDYSGAFESDVEDDIVEPPRSFITSSNAPSNLAPTTEHDESDDLEDAKRIEEAQNIDDMIDEGGPVTNGDTVHAQLDEPNTVTTSLGKVKMIQEIPEEDEYDEISIPSPSELDKLTKKQIAAEATKIGFTVNPKHNKVKMIESFVEQTESFITELQESGDFISASDVDDSEDDDEDVTRDGGFF
jgi:hypothetical protein